MTGRSPVGWRWMSTAALTSTHRATFHGRAGTSQKCQLNGSSAPCTSSISPRGRRLTLDTTLSISDLAEHEERHGRIGNGCAVFLRTDWHGRVGGEGLRFPGFGVDAARLLAEERGVVGLGIDTLGIDPGRATDFPIHRDVTLPRGVWHVENLTRLSEVPPVGSWAVIGVPRIGGASGFPARVLALVPSHLEG